MTKKEAVQGLTQRLASVLMEKGQRAMEETLSEMAFTAKPGTRQAEYFQVLDLEGDDWTTLRRSINREVKRREENRVESAAIKALLGEMSR